VFAWEEVPPNAWQNAEFIRIYESLGRAIRIGAAARESVDVTVIRQGN
jgi:hypothetical protein